MAKNPTFDLDAAIREAFPTATEAERELIAMRVKQRAADQLERR